MSEGGDHYLASGSSRPFVTSSGRTLASEVYTDGAQKNSITNVIERIRSLVGSGDVDGAASVLVQEIERFDQPSAIVGLLPDAGNEIAASMMRLGRYVDAADFCTRVLACLETFQVAHGVRVPKGWPLYTRAVARMYALEAERALPDLAAAVEEDRHSAEQGMAGDFRSQPAYLVQCYVEPLVYYDLWPPDAQARAELLSSLETIYGSRFGRAPQPPSIESLVARVRNETVRAVLLGHAAAIRTRLSDGVALGVFFHVRAILEGFLISILEPIMRELRGRYASTADVKLRKAMSKDLDELELEDALTISKAAGLLPLHTEALARLLQRFGNYIHPYKQARYHERFQLDESRAAMVEVATRLVLDGLSSQKGVASLSIGDSR